MLISTGGRDATRNRLFAAAASLTAALVVAVAVLALLLDARRRSAREVERAASDLAASSARLILQEATSFAIGATNQLRYAVERDRGVVPVAPESLLHRLVWSQRRALGDSLYDDTLAVGFSGASLDAVQWRWAGERTLRDSLARAAAHLIASAASGASSVEGEFPWRGENIALWVLLDRKGAGARAIDGVAFSHTRFISRFVPHVLATVPVLPTRRQTLAMQAKYVAVRVVDLASDLTEYDSGVLADEGAHGEYDYIPSAGHGFRVRVGLSNSVTDFLMQRSSAGVPEWTLWVLLTIAAGLAMMSAIITRRAFAGISARQRFVSAVSHELRTPLTQVRMSVETLRRLPSDDDERRERTLHALGRGTEQLTRTVENLLTLAKSELPTWNVRPRPTELDALTRTVVEVMQPVAAARGVEIVVVSPGPTWAWVDPDAFRQVILNLIDNALKYGPRDGAVHLRLHSYGTLAELSVADQGPGIPVQDRERIFTAFERLDDETTKRRDGLGLGLSVVRDILERHGGWIRVEDNIGGGALFVVGVPLATASDATLTTAEYPAVAR